MPHGEGRDVVVEPSASCAVISRLNRGPLDRGHHPHPGPDSPSSPRTSRASAWRCCGWAGFTDARLLSPLHAECIQCGDAVGCEAVSAVAGVVDPLAQAYLVAVQVLDVPLGDVEVAFSVMKGAGGGEHGDNRKRSRSRGFSGTRIRSLRKLRYPWKPRMLSQPATPGRRRVPRRGRESSSTPVRRAG
jgi:hypothetical protein